MQGTFELKTAHDLLEKLRSELAQLKRDPTDTYVAFNFFVTAERMKDWVFPGYSNEAARKRVQESSLLLQICSHLANGAKHLVAEAKHHRSVSDTRRTGGYWSPRYWPGGSLVVELQGDAARHLGSSISAVELAGRILAFWESRPELSKP